MVDDNAYRVVLTSCATLGDSDRDSINEHRIKAAEKQNTTKDEDGNKVTVDSGMLVARTRLARVIGNGFAHSTDSKQRRKAASSMAGREIRADTEAHKFLEATPGIATKKTQSNDKTAITAPGGVPGSAATTAIAPAAAPATTPQLDTQKTESPRKLTQSQSEKLRYTTQVDTSFIAAAPLKVDMDDMDGDKLQSF
jgi:hypothetical protein